MTEGKDKDKDKAEHKTSSGIPVRECYNEADLAGRDLRSFLGEPGSFPYTRGIHPRMYRERLWTMRQYAGFGTARETNARYRFLLARGQTGLSVAFDLPTQMGLDSDDPRAEGEVGKVGVAIDSLEDMRMLFEEIPLERVSTSMTINATAPILLALYIVLAEERGIDRRALRGTVQNDILKEYISRGTYIYPPDPSLRLAVDIMEFCAAEKMQWNAISVSGYHMREAGATAAQEVAFTLSNGLEYLRRAARRGLDIDSIAKRVSFFFGAHSDFFEEVAKFRAARRIWAVLVRERLGARDEEAAKLRFHTQTCGSTLTAQEALNNVVRVTLQALSSVLGGTQSLHTNSWDEALALPGEEAAKLALRTQQIIAFETGVAGTVDPLAGSYYIESLTAALEERALEYIEKVEKMGGAAKAVETGYFQEEIHRSAYEYTKGLEAGKNRVVGVNLFEEAGGSAARGGGIDSSKILRVGEEVRRDQMARLAAMRAARDQRKVERALGAVRDTAAVGGNLMPDIIDAVRAMATVGEISAAMKSVFGSHRPAAMKL
jgi:methylmalonyl-CoA mutase N-terminal domain/subunit